MILQGKVEAVESKPIFWSNPEEESTSIFNGAVYALTADKEEVTPKNPIGFIWPQEKQSVIVTWKYGIL